MSSRSTNIKTIFASTPFDMMFRDSTIDQREINDRLNNGNVRSIRLISTGMGRKGFATDNVFVISTEDFICVRTTGNVLVAMHKETQNLINFPGSFSGYEKQAALEFLRGVLKKLNPIPARVVTPQPTPPVVAPIPPRQDYGQPPYAYGHQYPAYGQPSPSPQATYNPHGGAYQTPPMHVVDHNPYGGYQPQPYQGGGVVQQMNSPPAAAAQEQDTEDRMTRYDPRPRQVDNRAIYYAALAALVILVGVVVVQGLYIHSVMLSTNDLTLKHENANDAATKRFTNLESHFNANDQKMDGKIAAQGNSLFTVSESVDNLRTAVNENAEYVGKAIVKQGKISDEQGFKIVKVEDKMKEQEEEIRDLRQESELNFARIDRQNAKTNERIQYMDSGMRYIINKLGSEKKGAASLPVIESYAFSDKINADAISTVVKPTLDVNQICTYVGYTVISFITLVWVINMANMCLNGRN